METKNMTDGFLTESLSKDQLQKVNNDLQFISLLTEEAKKINTRVIIHGGYAVDGALGKITRPHNDIDIQIYGNAENRFQVIEQLLQSIPKESFDSTRIEITDKKTDIYYHNYLIKKPQFCADIYYLRLKDNPFNESKVIIKNDGTINESQIFETQFVTLNGVSYEAVLPQNELEDKVDKKERGYKLRTEIDQDIYNLKLLLGKND